MDTLAVLARLERQALDRERLRLQAIDGQLDELGGQLSALRAAVTAERQVAAQLADGQAALAAYLPVNHARQRATAAHLGELEVARAEQMGRVLSRRLELERLEILAERRRQRHHDANQKREQQAIDELALIGAARRRRQ